MKRKLSLAVWLLATLALAGCGEDKGNVEKVSARKILASNIFISTASASTTRTAGDVDTTTRVSAANVVLDTTNNSLASDNLQKALDEELSVDVGKALIGTWEVTNRTSDPTYAETTGKVTFTADTVTLDSGRFAAAGLVEAGAENTFCPIPLAPISYEIINDSLIRVTWVGKDLWWTVPPPGAPRDMVVTKSLEAIISINSAKRDTMVFVGQGGCGNTGVLRISVLKKTL